LKKSTKVFKEKEKRISLKTSDMMISLLWPLISSASTQRRVLAVFSDMLRQCPQKNCPRSGPRTSRCPLWVTFVHTHIPESGQAGTGSGPTCGGDNTNYLRHMAYIN
jgi:hypothetical protein